MKHNKIISTLAVVAAALCCLAGCEKDKTTQTLQIITPGFENESNQKTYIDNATPVWYNNDMINVNGQQCTVTVNGTRYEANVPAASSYYAVYPSGINASINGVIVSVPASQNYIVANGKQVVRAPMAARLDGSNGNLVFRNACALLKVVVQNYNTNNAITVRSITATPQGNQLLAGNCGVNFSGPTTSTSNFASQNLSGGSASVTLTSINTQIAKGAEKEFYLIVRPYMNGKLDITVNATSGNTTKDYVQRQNVESTVLYNKMYVQPFASAFN